MGYKREGRGTVAKLCKFLVVFIIILLAGCGKQDGADDGDTTDTLSEVTGLSLTSNVNSINSDGFDAATLTVRALDMNNAVVEGAEIILSTTGGGLSSAMVTTNSAGQASFTLDSGFITSQQVVTVTASSGSVVATKAISILGTSVSFTTDKTSVGLNGATTATLTALVKDGSGTPVENVPITLDSDLGTINGSVNPVDLITNGSGQAIATFAGSTVAGTATITLTGPGTESLSILISDQQFSLSDTQGGFVNVTETDTITLTWIDASDTPVSGQTVTFDATKGTFDATGNSFVNVVTDAAGQASTVFHPDTVGADTIRVTSVLSLQDDLPITILAGDPTSIALNVNPTVVSRALNGITPTAVVSATVLDIQNRAVQGSQVAFSLTSGPGGGEGIAPAIATTNAAGIATATFSSGGLISAQDGITVLAKLVNVPGITDTATLTIADQAATIVIGETNEIQTLVIGSAEAAYALPFTVLVTDTNGSAIADQSVSLSVYPTHFKTGFFTDNDDFGTIIISGIFPNEDVNRNGNLDPGEDSVGGPFDNNRLDPGGVVSIPASVTTDSNGFAGFNVVYPKSFGAWIDVEISATTSVSGTESKAVLLAPLSVEEGDTPYLNSPFGP